MKKIMSIHDIAKHLKVSATAISFVLNGKAKEKGLSTGLIKKILVYIESIGYQPNLVAKSLRTGKSNMIAMLVESISDPFFASVAKVVETNAYKLGYMLFFASTENETGKTRSLINMFKEMQVDGYIIAPPVGIEADISELSEGGKPVILFDRYLPGAETINVVVDNYGGSYKAIRHLAENGCRQIGFITLDSGQTQMMERLRGYREALAGRALQENILFIKYNLPPQEILYEIENFLSKQWKQPDAVFFATNYLALSGLEVIKNLALNIPQDLSVASFDDNEYFRLRSPAITAVVQPVEAIAQKVVQCLMSGINAGANHATPTTIILPTQLIIRQSSPLLKTKPITRNKRA